ncbi:MAG: tetratricopeptide repeat protein [Aquificaceae bacterium]|nr:tetratricopeptide repeat protein [Aquificaceae bacterium]
MYYYKSTALGHTIAFWLMPKPYNTSRAFWSIAVVLCRFTLYFKIVKALLLYLYTVLLVSSCARIVLVENPLSSQEHTTLGYIYEIQGKWELAEREYLRAIKKDRKNWLAYYNLGNIYAKRGDWTKAEKSYRRALNINRDPDTLNNLAYVLNKKEEHCSALRFVKEAIGKADREEYRKTKEEILNAIESKKLNCLLPEEEGHLW